MVENLTAFDYNLNILKQITGVNNDMVLLQRLRPFKNLTISIAIESYERLVIDKLLIDGVKDKIIAKYLEVSVRRVRDRRKELKKRGELEVEKK